MNDRAAVRDCSTCRFGDSAGLDAPCRGCTIGFGELAGHRDHWTAPDPIATPAPAAPQPAEPDMPAICAALGFDPTNHHNAAKCPYCTPATPQNEINCGECGGSGMQEFPFYPCGMCNGLGKVIDAAPQPAGEAAPQAAIERWENRKTLGWYIADCKVCGESLGALHEPEGEAAPAQPAMESLGPEFEKVLIDNLPALYSRDDPMVAAQPAPLPQGWRAVPIEPTPRMLCAVGAYSKDQLAADAIYRAMLKAAPPLALQGAQEPVKAAPLEAVEVSMQPVEMDAQGVIRFKSNAIVRHLLDWATERGMGMNELASVDFSDDDRRQFAQLIGYSVSGYGGLSYISEESCAQADGRARALVSKGEPDSVHLAAHSVGGTVPGDRELLELAAKAAGYAVEVDMNWGTGGLPFFRLSGQKWNPLTDDGDALRLAVKLSFVVNIYNREDGRGVTAIHRGGEIAQEQHFGELYAATRRAIVRAAAEIGKAMP